MWSFRYFKFKLGRQEEDDENNWEIEWNAFIKVLEKLNNKIVIVIWSSIDESILIESYIIDTCEKNKWTLIKV